MIRLFIKICGMAAVMASSVITGRQMASGYKKRVAELDALRRCMMLLKNEISYSAASLDECFEAAGSRCTDETVGALFLDMSALIRQESCGCASDIWNICVKKNESRLHLNDTDIRELYNFGKNLGYLNADMQTDAVNLYMSVLAAQIDTAVQAVDNQCRVANTLSIACGALVCIILI